MENLLPTIPKPCNENWNKMQPEEKGRFCQSCAKTVIDFTKSSEAEISQYFHENNSIKTCGRFKKEQLKSITIEIPKTLIYNPTSFRKAFLLALFITMGTTLFSCKDENNTVHRLGKVVVIEDSISNNKDTLVNTVNKTDSLIEKGKVKSKLNRSNLTPRPQIHTMGIIEIEPIITGEIIMTPSNEKPETINLNKIYNAAEVEKVPTFSNNEIEFQNYITKNLTLSENIIEPITTIVQFVINKEGKLIDPIVIREKNDKINQQIKTMLQNSPLWIPGEIKGEKVNVKMTYPIRIKPQ